MITFWEACVEMRQFSRSLITLEFDLSHRFKNDNRIFLYEEAIIILKHDYKLKKIYEYGNVVIILLPRPFMSNNAGGNED